MASAARLHARVLKQAATGPKHGPGRQQLGLTEVPVGGGRPALLYTPSCLTDRQYDSNNARPPLMVLLHGAGGTAEELVSLYADHADERDMVLLAPASAGRTWDAIRDGFGADVARIDRALQHTFSMHDVDARHLAIGGFSDGASYALSLGLSNGALFSHVVAHSPGFMAPETYQDGPNILVSHGLADGTLPVRCSRNIVPRLRSRGYNVDYREFTGGHTVPASEVALAIQWFVGAPQRQAPMA